MTGRTYDAIIIGGGIRGACVAYYLSKAKAKVALIEKGDIASGASSRNGALIRMSPKEPQPYAALCIESGRLLLELVEDLMGPISLRAAGSMEVLTNESEVAKAREFVAQQETFPGVEVHLLDAATTRDLEPALSDAVIGSIYYPKEMDVNCMLFTLEVARAAKRYGTHVYTHTEVTGIHMQGDTITGVATTDGDFNAPVVVNAAGVDAPRIGHMVGLSVPVFRIRGQVIITERMPPLLNRFIGEAYQTAAGNLFVGVTNQFMSHELRSTFPEIAPALQPMIRVLPALREANVIRVWTGVRPVPPDGAPIMGSVVGLPGYYTVAGHAGITLGPVQGKITADLITTGRAHMPIHPWLLARFGRMQLQLARKMFEDYWAAGERYHAETLAELALLKGRPGR